MQRLGAVSALLIGCAVAFAVPLPAFASPAYSVSGSFSGSGGYLGIGCVPASVRGDIAPFGPSSMSFNLCVSIGTGDLILASLNGPFALSSVDGMITGTIGGPDSQNADVTGDISVTGGSGRYADATGTMTLAVTPGLHAITLTGGLSGTVNFSSLALPTVLPGHNSVVVSAGDTRELSIPVVLSHSAVEATTVQWNTYPVSGPGRANVGEDYTAASGTVTFAPGEASKAVTVTVYSGTRAEPFEWVVVSFHQATNATVGGFYGLGFGEILENR